jgi:hypothetical protein
MPDIFTEDATLCCGNCGRDLCTWREFKERARIVVLRDARATTTGSTTLSSDPLW